MRGGGMDYCDEGERSWVPGVVVGVRKERAVIRIVWFTIIEFRPCGMSVW